MLFAQSSFFRSVLVTLTLWSGISTASHAADGKAIFSTTCVACHGSKGEGNSKIGAPNIAGMDATYVARQLNAFASGARGAGPKDTYGAQMRGIVAGLKSEADRAAVANYIATLQKVKSTNTLKPDGAKIDLANGRNQYNAVCSSCHESRAQGNTQIGAPRLTGIDPEYIERQLTAFRNGSRGSGKDDKSGSLMKVGASMLPDNKSIRDVTSYILTLQP